MSELSADQLQQMHATLLQLQEELRDALAGIRDAAQPVSLDNPIGRISRVDALQQQAMAQANRRNLERRLEQTGAALRAFQVDEYGLCRKCEEAISFKRLKIRPESPLCLRCQGALERSR